MERKTTKLLNHVCQKVKKWSIFPNIITLLQEDQGNMFNTIHIRTIPKNDPIFKASGAKYWTMCFLTLRPKKVLNYTKDILEDDSGNYMDDVYLFFSDSDEGIYKKSLNIGEYRINYFTPCVFGSNKINAKDEAIKCSFSTNNDNDNDTLYVNVDWITGEPLSFQPNDLDGIKKTIKNKISPTEIKLFAKKFIEDINNGIDSFNSKHPSSKGNSKKKDSKTEDPDDIQFNCKIIMPSNIDEVFEYNAKIKKIIPFNIKSTKSKKKSSNSLTISDITNMFAELMSKVENSSKEKSSPKLSKIEDSSKEKSSPKPSKVEDVVIEPIEQKNAKLNEEVLLLCKQELFVDEINKGRDIVNFHPSIEVFLLESEMVD